MLSLIEGRPIAIVKKENNKNTKEILYVTENRENSINTEDMIDLLGEEFIIKYKITLRDLYKIVDHIKNPKIQLVGEKQKLAAKRALEIIENTRGKEFKIDAGKMQLLPNIEKRDAITLAGMSGSGKSYWAAEYTKQYIKMFPGNSVLLISRKKDDPAFDVIPELKRILINEDLISQPIQMEELANSLVIFDDCDILEKPYFQMMNDLRDQVLEGGRQQKTYIITIIHQIMNYKATRRVLNESDYTVIFPASGSRYYIEQYLSKYAGLTKPEQNKVFNLPSRWVCIHNVFPRFVLYEKGAYIV
jgi:hypothetical protein